MRQLFISIELVICKPKIRYLKLLQKMLNKSKISQVLPTKFSPLVVKIADSEKLSGVEIMETSQSFVGGICTRASSRIATISACENYLFAAKALGAMRG